MLTRYFDATENYLSSIGSNMGQQQLLYIVVLGLSACTLCGGYTLMTAAEAAAAAGQQVRVDDSLPYVRSKRGSLEPMPRSTQELQAMLHKVKAGCARRLNFPESINEKVLLHEQHPTPKEKCLMECVLKGIKLMDDSNKLSLDSIAQLASMISDKNELIMAIAIAKAENCNRHIEASKQPCEVANQLNKCIGRELAQHRVRLAY